MSVFGDAKIVNFENLDEGTKKQILEAIEGRKLSYSPYSKFAVGACVKCADGTLYRGCNVENAVLNLTICAERTAVVKGISEGEKDFVSIAVIGDQDDAFTTPCGSCRQFLSEFNPEMTVYVTKPSLGKVLVTSVENLLPIMFRTFVKTNSNEC